MDTKEDIIAYLNSQKKLALEDILVVYGKVLMTHQITELRVTDLYLDHLVIQFHHAGMDMDIEKVILLEPPLKRWGEALPRLSDLIETAAAKRGVSSVQITSVVPPTAAGWALIAAIYLPVVCYYKRNLLSWLLLPNFLYNFLAKDTTLVTVIAAVFICHAAECYFLLRPRLLKYRVPKDYAIEWCFYGMFEGYPAIRRFDALANSLGAGKSLRTSDAVSLNMKTKSS